MRTLVLCDDKYHPARIARAGLEPLTAAGFSFDFIENALVSRIIRQIDEKA